MKYLNETGLAYLWNNKLKPKFAELTNKTDQLSNPNLLINGDFQVWQRGEELNHNKNGVSYLCDMWFVNTGGKSLTLKKVDNGAKLINFTSEGLVNLCQIVNIKAGNKYTIVASVNDVIQCMNIVGGEYKTEGFIGYSAYNTNERIYVQLANNQVVNYVALFEGTVAWKHQKEDYATALMRCKQFVRKYDITVVDYSFVNSNILYYVIPNEIGKDVTLKYIKNTAVLNQGMTNLGFAYNGVTSIKKDSIVIEMYKANHGITSGPCPLEISYIVTREPL